MLQIPILRTLPPLFVCDEEDCAIGGGSLSWENFPVLFGEQQSDSGEETAQYCHDSSSSAGRHHDHCPQRQECSRDGGANIPTSPSSSDSSCASSDDEDSSSSSSSEEEEGEDSSACEDELRIVAPLSSPSSSEASSPSFSFGWGDFPVVTDAAVDAGRNDVIPMARTPAAVATTYSSHRPAAAGQKEQQQVQQPRQRGGRCWSRRGDVGSSRKKKLVVHFGGAPPSIREYDIELGDHPLCCAYPITLGWTYRDVVSSNRNSDDDDIQQQLLQQQCRQASSSSTFTSDGRFRRHGAAARRLDVLERRERLARALRCTVQEVDALERQRREQDLLQQQQQEEEKAGRNDEGSEEDEAVDNDGDRTASLPSCHLQRVPTVRMESLEPEPLRAEAKIIHRPSSSSSFGG
jgi:hypothetical protein